MAGRTTEAGLVQRQQQWSLSTLAYEKTDLPNLNVLEFLRPDSTPLMAGLGIAFGNVRVSKRGITIPIVCCTLLGLYSSCHSPSEM